MQIDARGPRFGATLTLLVLIAVLYFESISLLVFQTIIVQTSHTRFPAVGSRRNPD